MATIALEIGGAFLFAALLMHLSSRGILPEILRHIRMLPIVAALLMAGLAVYRWLPSFDVPPSASHARVDAVLPAAAIPAKATSGRVVTAPLRAKIREVESPADPIPTAAIAPPEAAPEPVEAAEPAAIDEAPVPEKGNRVKRWMRSVGRAFHPHREKAPG